MMTKGYEITLERFTYEANKNINCKITCKEIDKVFKIKTEIEKLQEEHASMGERIEKMMHAEKEKTHERVFGFLPKAGSGEVFWISETDSFGVLNPIGYGAHGREQSKYKGIYFKTEEECQEWCDALNVQNELRCCEGVKRAVVGERNYTLYLNDLSVVKVADTYLLLCGIYFKTEELALKAVETIGEDRLIKAFKVLSGCK